MRSLSQVRRRESVSSPTQVELRPLLLRAFSRIALGGSGSWGEKHEKIEKNWEQWKNKVAKILRLIQTESGCFGNPD